jgi:hypothetical protein
MIDYKNLTAPCGIACFECGPYKARTNDVLRKIISERTGMDYDNASCEGCRNRDGKCFLFEKNNIISSGQCFLFANEEGQCRIYLCAEARGIHNCSECGDFPCDLLQPLADKANIVPHNLKVYNLSLIKKMGLEKWAEEKAGAVWKDYLSRKFDS